ncbi:anthrone oxygenase family protein [Microbispora siamensis]
MLAVLDFVALVGAGVTAGVLFCVALSIMPAFNALPVDRYVELHRLVGRNYDPTMPITVLATTLACVARASLTPGWPRALPFAAAALLLLAVSAVSHLGNVPINRLVKGAQAQPSPSQLYRLRRRWRLLHLLRTGLALLALTCEAAGVVAWQHP